MSEPCSAPSPRLPFWCLGVMAKASCTGVHTSVIYRHTYLHTRGGQRRSSPPPLTEGPGRRATPGCAMLGCWCPGPPITRVGQASATPCCLAPRQCHESRGAPWLRPAALHPPTFRPRCLTAANSPGIGGTLGSTLPVGCQAVAPPGALGPLTSHSGLIRRGWGWHHQNLCWDGWGEPCEL